MSMEERYREAKREAIVSVLSILGAIAVVVLEVCGDWKAATVVALWFVVLFQHEYNRLLKRRKA